MYYNKVVFSMRIWPLLPLTVQLPFSAKIYKKNQITLIHTRNVRINFRIWPFVRGWLLVKTSLISRLSYHLIRQNQSTRDSQHLKWSFCSPMSLHSQRRSFDFSSRVALQQICSALYPDLVKYDFKARHRACSVIFLANCRCFDCLAFLGTF